MTVQQMATASLKVEGLKRVVDAAVPERREKASAGNTKGVIKHVPDYASLGDLNTNPPPHRQWAWQEFCPLGSVTALMAAGGTGKSLAIQQLLTGVANGVSVFGQKVQKGPALGFLCEDDNEELRRRQRAILASLGRSPEYSSDDLYIEGRAGLESVMMSFGADRLPFPAPFLELVERECERIKPVVLALDNISQLFGGIENDRFQVTAFANLLTGIARRHNCAVVLVGHVAKAQGSEYSGSTAWEAAVRTRLWMERREDGLIELHKRKANYSGLSSILLEYRNGAFVQVDPADRGDTEAVRLAEPVLLAALATFTARQVTTSHHPTARTNLITLATKEDLIKGVPRGVATRTMSALLDSGRIVPNATLPWKTRDRHQARGLALGEGGGA